MNNIYYVRNDNKKEAINLVGELRSSWSEGTLEKLKGRRSRVSDVILFQL